MTIATSAPLSAAEPTLSQEIAALKADYPDWHFWDSDGRRHYAVKRTRHSGFTVYALDPPNLRQAIEEASYDLEHLNARDERRASAVAA